MSLALDAVVSGSGSTGLRTVVPAVTLHGSFRCRTTGLCCARSAPKGLRTFRISGPDLAECEFEAASLDCGGTVGLGGSRTRTGRAATWPHLGHNLDAGRAVSVTAADKHPRTSSPPGDASKLQFPLPAGSTMPVTNRGGPVIGGRSTGTTPWRRSRPSPARSGHRKSSCCSAGSRP